MKVDVIDTEAITSDDLDGIDGPDRLFVAGHRYALESAAVATVVAGTGDGAPSASFPLATPAGLIGTKIHALQVDPTATAPSGAPISTTSTAWPQPTTTPSSSRCAVPVRPRPARRRSPPRDRAE